MTYYEFEEKAVATLEMSDVPKKYWKGIMDYARMQDHAYGYQESFHYIVDIIDCIFTEN